MGNYYLTVSGDADDIVTSAIAVATSSVTPFGAGAPLSGTYVTTSALSATPNSKVIGVSGGDLSISEDSSSVTLESAFTSGNVRSLVLTGGAYTDLSAVKFCATASGASLVSEWHSAGSPEACPIPNPYIWVSSSDGTAATSGNFGNGAVVTGVSSNGHWLWEEANTKLNVSGTGIYRATLVGVMSTAANQNVVIQLYVNDVQQFITGEYVHGLVDPDVVTMDWVGFMNAGDNLRVTHSSGSNSNFTLGSTLTVTRLA